MTKFKDEMERIEKEAHLQAATSKPSGGEIYAHYWAQGVEEALIWAAGKGTSDGIRGLEHAADAAEEAAAEAAESLRLDVVDNENQHFVVSGTKPFRVEVSVVGGRVLAEVYPGADADMGQDPVGAFDGTNDNNTSWTEEI